MARSRREKRGMLFSKCTRAVGRRLNAVRNISASFSPACSTNSTKMDAGEMTSSTYYDGDDIPADQQRLVRAAVLGVPNAGKSTLVNQLVGKKVKKTCIIMLCRG